MGEKYPATVSILKLQRRERANPDGSYVLSTFDCQVGDFQIFGCTLLRGKDQTLFVGMPRRNHVGERLMAALKITNGETLHQMMVAARQSYRAAGGHLDEDLRR